MFTDETAACMLVGEHAFVMLLNPREVRKVLEAADRRIRPRTRLALYCFSAVVAR